jgi:energy-coupling factor transport system permease protein
MSNFAMGRYIPYHSFLHRMDPRAKVFGLILLMVAIFMSFPSWEMTAAMEGIAFLVIMVLLFASHLSLRQLLGSLKSLWLMVIFLLIIYIVTPRTKVSIGIAFSIYNYPIYWDSFAEAGKILIRLMLMIELSMILTATTKPLDLTYALEWYMTPLKWIGFPSHIVAMTITLALRFIPTILEDVNRIMKAQASRGVDFEHGRIGSKFRAIISLIVPLFVSSFIRSDDLANAMECRGYDPKLKRTRYRTLRFSWMDLLLTILAAGFATVFIYASAIHFDAFTTWWGIVTHVS